MKGFRIFKKTNVPRGLAVALLLCAGVLGAQPLRFDSLGWQAALDKARSEDKIIFLDAYTQWCGPCKMMSARCFPDSSVGAWFNPRFVNLKMDMERGEGPTLAQRYGIELYPTLLFLHGDGTVAHRAVGYHNPAELLALAAAALDPARNLLALETRYRNGERSQPLLLALLEARAAAADPRTGQLAETILKLDGNFDTPGNRQIILNYVEDPFSESFRFMVRQREAFAAEATRFSVADRIDYVFENYLQNNPTLQLGEVQRLYATCYPEQGERLASAYRLSYYRQRSDEGRFRQSALDHYTRYPSDDPDELNEIAWLFAENSQEPAELKQALQWAKKSVALREMPHNQETLARILAKTGQRKAALKAARRSLALAQAAGEDGAQVEALIQELEKK